MTTPTPTTVQVKLQLRADTAANWSSVNPVLLNNELALETDTKKLKVGNGSTAWNSLAYFPFVVSGGTVLGNLEIGSTGTLTFEGSTANGFETTLAVTDPTADRTITLPNQSGTVIVSGNASIVDADISASAEIAVSKLADGAARQLLQTDAAGTGVEWTSNVDVPGTLDVTGAATFDAAVTIAGDLTVNGTTTNINTQNLVVEDKNIILADVATPTDTTADGGGITLKGATDKTITWSDTTDAWTSNQAVDLPAGSAATPSLIFGADTNTGIYSPGADQVAISTNGTGRLFVNSDGSIDFKTESNLSVHRAGGGPGINLRAAEGSQASPAAISTSTTLGAVRFQGFDSTAYRAVSTVAGVSDGAVSSTSSPGSLTFNTTPSASVTPQERLRITSAGLVGVGTSSPGYLLTAVSSSNSATTYLGQLLSSANVTGTSATYLRLEKDSGYGGAIGGYISQGVGSGLKLSTLNNGTLSEAVTITHLGNVGIGTASPAVNHHVYGASGVITSRVQSGSGTVELAHNGTDAFLSTNGGSTVFYQSTTERARIDSSGRLLVGTSSVRAVGEGFQSAQNSGIYIEQPSADLTPFTCVLNRNDTNGPRFIIGKSRGTTVGSSTIVQNGDTLGQIIFAGADGTDLDTRAAEIVAVVDGTPGANDMPGRLVFSTTKDGQASPTEALRIDSQQRVGIGKTPDNSSSNGVEFWSSGVEILARSSGTCLYVNRNTSDGTIVEIQQDAVQEGSISVSGTTVSYNGAHLSRWSQLPSGAERTEILRGSVLSNIDEMCEWGEEDNEQLNRMKVSDVEGDKNVSGVFQAWDDDDDTYTNDFYCAMTGDFIIRIGAGVTVERGNLLMSAGDGTAKPQDDDIIRSKTIAKVTSTNVSCTYDDGSYCVPCVLMAC
jgi:hypothetical protein